MLSPNSYSQFITKYPVFADPAFGGSAAFAEAYSLASAYVGYWENIGLNWLGFKQTAIDYKTACELQNRYNQKSGSLASIGSAAGEEKIKTINVDGEYSVTYQSANESNNSNSNFNNVGYYCDEFENLKSLILEQQLGDRFLYSHE